MVQQSAVVPTGKNAAQGLTSTRLKSKDLVPRTFEDDQILNVFQNKKRSSFFQFFTENNSGSNNACRSYVGPVICQIYTYI